MTNLNRHTNKQLLVEHVNKLLIPFLIGVLIIAPLVGIFTFNANGWSGIASLPKVIKGLIIMVNGMESLWFLAVYRIPGVRFLFCIRKDNIA